VKLHSLDSLAAGDRNEVSLQPGSMPARTSGGSRSSLAYTSTESICRRAGAEILDHEFANRASTDTQGRPRFSAVAATTVRGCAVARLQGLALRCVG
jgi:hypothetical protein